MADYVISQVAEENEGDDSQHEAEVHANEICE
jgi:hypothetical protein